MIRLRNVTVSFEGRPVLRDYTLALPEEGAIAITGPSGAGKTTLLRTIAGLITPQAGSVEAPQSMRVSMVFQEDRLLPWYTAYENVLLAQPDGSQPNGSQPGDRAQREQLARDWLNHMELGDDMQKRPAELSGGMRRRVAIARACAYGGDVLLMDEPFKGMDEALRARLIPYIKAAAPLIVLVTHDLPDAEMMGAELVPLVNEGRSYVAL